MVLKIKPGVCGNLKYRTELSYGCWYYQPFYHYTHYKQKICRLKHKFKFYSHKRKNNIKKCYHGQKSKHTFYHK